MGVCLRKYFAGYMDELVAGYRMGGWKDILIE